MLPRKSAKCLGTKSVIAITIIVPILPDPLLKSPGGKLRIFGRWRRLCVGENFVLFERRSLVFDLGQP